MMKSDQISLPLEESIIAKAAHFFTPHYAPQMSWGEWQQEQRRDENISKVIGCNSMPLGAAWAYYIKVLLLVSATS